jgi:hypothetical protein
LTGFFRVANVSSSSRLKEGNELLSYSYDSCGVGRLRRVLAPVERERRADPTLGGSRCRRPRGLGLGRGETPKAPC